MLRYYIIVNTGEKDFVTYEENQTSLVSGYPADVWVTENTEWAQRVGAVKTTKEDAQTRLNEYIDYLRSIYVAPTPENAESNPSEDEYPQYIVLP
jgi:hypothetical protein